MDESASTPLTSRDVQESVFLGKVPINDSTDVVNLWVHSASGRFWAFYNGRQVAAVTRADLIASLERAAKGEPLQWGRWIEINFDPFRNSCRSGNARVSASYGITFYHVLYAKDSLGKWYSRSAYSPEYEEPVPCTGPSKHAIPYTPKSWRACLARIAKFENQVKRLEESFKVV